MHTLSFLRRSSPTQLDLPALIELPSGNLRLHRLLGKGRSGYSFHAVRERKEVVFKYMHEEIHGYSPFEDARTSLEERDYHRLREMGVRVPELLSSDPERGYLIREFIPGMTAAELVTKGLPSPDLLAQLFEFAHICREATYNIDYFPTNFVIRNGRLYYVDYEVHPYMTAWSLERRGLYYWANTAGMRAFLHHGSTRLLHAPDGAGEPLRAPFEQIVRSWIQEFSTIEQD